MDNNTIIEGRKLEAKSSKKIGGDSHLDLPYSYFRLSKAKKVVETGVAYGWSSLVILKALNKILVINCLAYICLTQEKK